VFDGKVCVVERLVHLPPEMYIRHCGPFRPSIPVFGLVIMDMVNVCARAPEHICEGPISSNSPTMSTMANEPEDTGYLSEDGTDFASDLDEDEDLPLTDDEMENDSTRGASRSREEESQEYEDVKLLLEAVQRTRSKNLAHIMHSLLWGNKQCTKDTTMKNVRHKFLSDQHFVIYWISVRHAYSQVPRLDEFRHHVESHIPESTAP
jgi:hypothetical protein